MGLPSVKTACASLIPAICDRIEHLKTPAEDARDLTGLSDDLVDLKLALEALVASPEVEHQQLIPRTLHRHVLAIAEAFLGVLADPDALAGVQAQSRGGGRDEGAIVETGTDAADLHQIVRKYGRAFVLFREVVLLATQRQVGSSALLAEDEVTKMAEDGNHILTESTRLLGEGESQRSDSALGTYLTDLNKYVASLGVGSSKLSSDDDGPIQIMQSPISVESPTLSSSARVGDVEGVAGNAPPENPIPRRKKKKVTWNLDDDRNEPLALPRSDSDPTPLAVSAASPSTESLQESQEFTPIKLEHTGSFMPISKSSPPVRGISISAEQTLLIVHYSDESIVVWDRNSQRMLHKFRLNGNGWLPRTSSKLRVRRAISISDSEPFVAIEVENSAQTTCLELWDWKRKKRLQVLLSGDISWAFVTVRHICGEIIAWDRACNIIRRFRQTRLVTANMVNILQDSVLVDVAKDIQLQSSEYEKPLLALSQKRPLLVAAVTVRAGGHTLLIAVDLNVPDRGQEAGGRDRIQKHLVDYEGLSIVALSTDGHHVMSVWQAPEARDSMHLITWRIQDDTIRRTRLPGQQASLSLDGRLLAGWDDKGFTIFDGVGGTLLFESSAGDEKHEKRLLSPTAVDFSRDYRIMACGSENGSIGLFKLKNSQDIPPLRNRDKYKTL